jgi:hypothetical protein
MRGLISWISLRENRFVSAIFHSPRAYILTGSVGAINTLARWTLQPVKYPHPVGIRMEGKNDLPHGKLIAGWRTAQLHGSASNLVCCPQGWGYIPTKTVGTYAALVSSACRILFLTANRNRGRLCSWSRGKACQRAREGGWKLARRFGEIRRKQKKILK